MIFSDISFVDENFIIRKHQDIVVRDGVICKICSHEDREQDEECYPGTDKLLMPGFVNLHTHSPMTLLRGHGEGLVLERWLNERIFPFESKMNTEDAYFGAMLSFAEMLRSGTVSASDMYMFGDGIARAVEDCGIKLNLAGPESSSMISDYHGACDGRLRCDAYLHAEYTCEDESRIVQQVELAKLHQIGFQVHLSETRSEHESCKQRHNGMTPAEYLASFGVFDVPVTAAHCVYLEQGDLDLFAKSGATVAHCPQSNLKLASGIAPIASYLFQGIRVGIGTDGAASNNNVDLLEEISTAGLLMKVKSGDPTCGSPSELLKMAAANGAQAQMRGDCGTIQVGSRADLCVFDLTDPVFYPRTDLLAAVCYAADSRAICLTMVDGKILYQNGEYKTIDIEKITAEVQQRYDQILCR